MVSGVRWRDALFLVILDRKCTLYRSKWALPWAVLNVALSVSLYLDIRKGSFSQLFEDYASFIWYLEMLFAGIFSLCALHRFWQYLWPTVGQSPLEIMPVHQRLCAITENDAGFKLKTPRKCEETNAEHQTPSPRHVLIPSMLNYSSTSPSFLSSTPLNCSINSWTSPGVTSGSNLSTSSSSWIYHSGSSPVKHMLSPVSPSKADCNSSFTPRKSSYIANFTSSSEKQIKNEQQLEQYLKDYEEKEQKSILMSSGNSGSISNFWSLQRPASNFISMLRKYQYQPSSRSPQSASTHRDDSPATLTADSVWTKLKVSEEELNLWIEKLRKWLCQTIVAKVINEIDDLNHSLRRIGSPDIQIGEVSQSTLRHIAISKGQNLPTLSAILPYLDVTSNQEYLVYRLKGLALGGSMSEFKWNSGGVYKGKPWTDDLPTDSAIVMHIFCCYMDSRLPPDPHYPDGKTFTSQYFKKNPERPAASKESLCIYQSRVTPPHYRVIIGIDVWDLPKGRNNLFCAILLFLHHVKSKQCGMLGRVNLGPSGVNILCTIDN